MIFDVTLGSSDIERSGAFYDAVLGALGHVRSPESTEGWIGWGPRHDDGVSLWVTRPFDGKPPTAGNGTMITFRARNAAEVHAFHAAAVASGGSDEGAPGTRPDYAPTFYVAYVRDPDGNKLACVFHRHQPRPPDEPIDRKRLDA
jgi:catechol 2,3-dioxygenase-like lactoylglutathione lyase family enzyme